MVPRRPLTFPIFVFMEVIIILSTISVRKMTLAVFSVAVKLTIKSFTVPELSVDLPESATISNLKVGDVDFLASGCDSDDCSSPLSLNLLELVCVPVV